VILTGLEQRSEDGRTYSACRLEFKDPKREPFDLWVAVPAEYGERLDPTATPFVPLAAMVAGRLGENLKVDGPASPRIVAGANRAGALFADWWEYRPPRVRATREAHPGSRGDGVGLLFSRGADTSASLVRSLKGGIPERVTHLLSGYDIEWVFTTEVQREMWAGHERAADAWGLPLVRLESNARELLHGLIGWPRCFGVAYLGPALALGPTLGSILTGATQPPVRPQPRGSRFDLDPLWSTERTLVRQDAYELSRPERIAIVATDPIALEHLKVCWAGRGAGNCGRCSKCLRTMSALAAVGALNGHARFDDELSADAVRAAPLERGGASMRSVADFLPRGLAELAAAWREKAAEADALVQSEERQRERARRRRRIRRTRRRWRRRVRSTLMRGRGA
jgi:hypothetical protein